MTTPCTRTSAPGNFGESVLCHHYYILSLSHLCLGVEKILKIKYITFSLYDLYGHALAQEPLLRGS